METLDVTLVWDFGGFETEATLTLTQLYEVAMMGQKDPASDAEVTSVLISTNTSDEFAKRMA